MRPRIKSCFAQGGVRKKCTFHARSPSTVWGGFTIDLICAGLRLTPHRQHQHLDRRWRRSPWRFCYRRLITSISIAFEHEPVWRARQCSQCPSRGGETVARTEKDTETKGSLHGSGAALTTHVARKRRGSLRRSILS